MELRWYYFLSFWTLILCATYRIHGFNTYPLLLFCLVGLIAVPLLPAREPIAKRVLQTSLLLGVHLSPFLWTPAIINTVGIQFGLCVLIVYMLFMMALDKNIIQAYSEAIYKHYDSTFVFFKEGLGL
jgi:hypothetical protein